MTATGTPSSEGQGDLQPDASVAANPPARAAHPLASMVVALVVWSIVVSAASSFVTWRVLNNQLQADLAMRPPVVVLNSFGWIKHAGHGSTVEQRYVSGAERLKDVIATLRKHGALVLDASGVRAAPPQVMLKTPRGR